MAYAQQKKFDAAIRELPKSGKALSQQNSLVLGGLGYAYAISSDKNQARGGPCGPLESQGLDPICGPYAFAVVYAGAWR